MDFRDVLIHEKPKNPTKDKERIALHRQKILAKEFKNIEQLKNSGYSWKQIFGAFCKIHPDVYPSQLMMQSDFYLIQLAKNLSGILDND